MLWGLQLANATLSPIHARGKVPKLKLDVSMSRLMYQAFPGLEGENDPVGGIDLHMTAGGAPLPFLQYDDVHTVLGEINCVSC